jgi:hypothetical protein
MLSQVNKNRTMTTREISKVFIQHDLMWGRMISASKSDYLQKNPENDVIFNANIFMLNRGKVWWGDLDLTLEWNSLEKIASYFGESLFVLRELDGRFENEERSNEEIIRLAHAEIRP